MRGELSCCRATNVALIMLCGFDVPTDLATMSLMPSVSNTARIGPPAMMPVPAGAARKRHLAGAEAALDVVMQRAAVAQRHADQAALGRFRRLADRLGHLARLAGAVADAAALVADDDDRREGEAPAALHHLRDAIDGDQLVDQFVFLVAVAVASRSRSRGPRPEPPGERAMC